MVVKVSNQWTRMATTNKKRLIKLAQNSSITTGKIIIKISPVDTGAFKEGWVTAKGSPIDSQGAKGAGLIPVAKSLKIGEILYFTESLPYNFRLEFDGWSNQAPNGMVRITIADWQGINDREIKKLR